jgi:hypothetical protein
MHFEKRRSAFGGRRRLRFKLLRCMWNRVTPARSYVFAGRNAAKAILAAQNGIAKDSLEMLSPRVILA